MFWINLLLGIMVPAILTVIGGIFLKHPPKEINFIAGYRTARSMKSREAWDFANRYSARLMLICGIVLLIISAAIMVIFRNKSEDIQAMIMVVLCTVQTIAIVVTIIPVEKALKDKFDEQGRPKK